MLVDYVIERGSSSLKDKGLNFLDLLAFSECAYFDFPESCFGKPLSQAMLQAKLPMYRESETGAAASGPLTADEIDLAAAVSLATRYAAVIVRGFRQQFLAGTQQFAALALSWEDVGIIVFRGTDTTLTGWRESFKLALDASGPSQRDALEFLEAWAAEISGPLIVCGHSKGGNLAVFAASSCRPGLQERIAAVVSFDGPGLPAALREKSSYQAIAERTYVFIPRASIIGSIHEHPGANVQLIGSRKPFMAQHYPYNWRTSGAGFVGSRRSPDAALAGGALQMLIDRLSDRQKTAVIDKIFNGLGLFGRESFK